MKKQASSLGFHSHIKYFSKDTYFSSFNLNLKCPKCINHSSKILDLNLTNKKIIMVYTPKSY